MPHLTQLLQTVKVATLPHQHLSEFGLGDQTAPDWVSRFEKLGMTSESAVRFNADRFYSASAVDGL